MNTISHSTVFKINPDTVYTLIDEEAVIMGAGDDQLYSTNAVATELWQLLEKQPATIPMLQEYLMEHFEVDAVVCLNDVENLMTAFLEKKLVTVLDNPR